MEALCSIPCPRRKKTQWRIKVTIYRANGDTKSGTDETNNTKAGTDCTLSGIEQKIVEMLKADEKTTQKKLSEELVIFWNGGVTHQL